MKKILLVVFGVIFIFSVSLWGQKKKVSYQQEEISRGGINLNNSDVSFNKILLNPKIALIALDGSILVTKLEGDFLGCNDKIVSKNVNGSYTIKQLLEKMFNFSGYNEYEGVYNVFKYSDLKVENLDIDNRTIKVKLFGELIISGMCDKPRVFSQIGGTIGLFYPDSIDNVEILINGKELGDFLSEKD